MSEYWIIAINNDSKGVIKKVKDINGEIYTTSKIISLIKEDNVVKTAYKMYEKDKDYTRGSKVTYYKDDNGHEHIKTNSNKKDKDNLDNLPKF